MAKITKMSTGYEFADMSAIGMRLVNEFQRLYPLLCVPSPHPDYRFIRHGSPEQNRVLAALVVRVKVEDPEPTSALSRTHRRLSR